jgi:hypothetical protein
VRKRSEENYRTGCARFRRRGEWEGFAENLGRTKGADDDRNEFGRTRQTALETGTDTRALNKKSKNRSQTRKTQNDSRSRLTPIAARSWARNEANSNDENESVNRGYRDMTGVIRPLFDATEVSDDGPDCRQQVTAFMSRFPTLFTPVNRCSKYTRKTAISAILSGPSARLAGGNASRQHVAASWDRTRSVLGRAV